MTDEAARFATPRVAAGALFVDDQGRVLLVKPTYKNGWDIPGGYVERGESPAAACGRELFEELGIEHTVDRLLAVDWAPIEHEGDKLLFVFDGGNLPVPLSGLQLDDSEISAAEWVAPASLTSYLNPRLAPRISEALSARPGFVYLEYGSTPPHVPTS